MMDDLQFYKYTTYISLFLLVMSTFTSSLLERASKRLHEVQDEHITLLNERAAIMLAIIKLPVEEFKTTKEILLRKMKEDEDENNL